MTLTLELSDEQTNALQAKAAAEGLSVEAWIVKLAEPPASANPPRPPIWEIIAERMKNVPAEDWESVPKDGSSQIDHYVYGVPKRELADMPPPERPLRSIANFIVESMKDLPPEIMATLPTDGASQHDHYIYGLPKRDL